MDENKKEELFETMMSVDKNLKAMVRKSFKQLFISVSPFLLLLLTPILPKTFFPYMFVISSVFTATLATIFKFRNDRNDDKPDEQLRKLEQVIYDNKSCDFGMGRNNSYTNSVKQNMNHPFLTNVLSSCLNIEDFHEYMISFFEFLKESGKIKHDLLDENAIKDFLSPIFNLLGNNVKIILTLDSIADIIVRMQEKKTKKASVTYLYDGDNFYIYSPIKETIILFPISKDDMFKIFDSYKANYENAMLVQFFTEVYGPLDNEDDFKRGK